MALLDPKQAELLKPLKKSKYAAKRIRVDLINFDSHAECARYCQLRLLQAEREICELRIKPMFQFASGIKYFADFEYIESFVRNNAFAKHVVEDVKSPATAKNRTYVIKKKLLKHEFGIVIKEVFIDPERADTIIKAYLGGVSNGFRS